MARKYYSFFVLLILFEIQQSVRSENNSFNPYSSEFNRKSDLQNAELIADKNFEDSLENKITEKRQFKNGDLNYPTTSEGQFENEYSASRGTNFGERENENPMSENNQEYHNWENDKNKFSFPSEPGIRSRQPLIGRKNLNRGYDWENKNNMLENSQSRWKGEENFKQFSNSQWDDGVNWSNNARTSGMINENERNGFSDERNTRDFNQKISATTFNNENMGNFRNYNNERMREMDSDYVGHSNPIYSNRNSASFWNPNCHKPEKVIINFNTECLTPRQFSNQLVHKFIIAQKPPISTRTEDSSYQIPETALGSPHLMGSQYYM